MEEEMVKATEDEQIAPLGKPSKKERLKKQIKTRFTAKNLALMAVFVALAYVVSFLEIPLPLFGAEFLKLDFGNVFIVLISFLLGPVEGVIVCFVKEAFRCIGSSSLCAGELANFLVTSSYLLLPSVVYRYKKGIKTVLVSLLCACLIATGTALLTNRFIIFPTYALLFGGSIFGMTVSEAFSQFWVAVIIFNLIKTASVSLLTLLLYKRLSNFLKKRFAKFDRRYYNRDMNVFISKSREQTESFACEYAKTLRRGDVVLLEGEMGAGKTVFSKGVARGLGIEEEVTSPTYAYMNDYDGKLFHYDCYRIQSVEQAEQLGLADYFDMGICLIEWAENIAPLLPKNVKRVRIIKRSETEREIEY